MDGKVKREIHGYLHNGERLFLGHCPMTDEEVQRFLGKLAINYGGEREPGVLQFRFGVFNVHAFAGVKITPPSTKGD